MGSKIEGYGAAAVLRRLARDWCDPEGMHTLWDVLRVGTEEDWEVDPSHPGSVPDLLREIADRAEAEACPKPWPRFDDDELVRIGDEFEDRGKGHTIHAVYLSGQEQWGIEDELGMTMWLDDGERVKRPFIRAADGEPLEVGQTVWNINNGMEFNVSRLPKSGEYQAVEVRHRNGSSTSYDPCQLTHQRPDTWERIEQDARSMLDDGLHPNDEWVLDLVRRCRALAERGE